MRNSSKKKNKDSTTIKILFKCTRGNRKNKLVAIRIGREAKRKMYTQKTGCSATITLSANDKDNPASRQSLLLGTVTIHSYKSIKSTSLVYYCRQLRGTRFREFLATCRSSGVLPQQTRALAKAEFITKPGLSKLAAVLVLRDIYNKFAKIRYKMIVSKTLVDRVLEELANNDFFTAYTIDKSNRLYCLFFAYPQLIRIYKDNSYILIFDCTYKVYASSLPLLCFDFVTRLGIVLLLAYVLMLGEAFEDYIQAFQQLQRLFEEYEIDDPNLIIYNRDRAAINVLEVVFLGVPSILYTQYINTAVEVQACKTFGQQKNPDSTRYIPSELAAKFLALYKTYRLALSEAAFNEACAKMLERAQRDELSNSDSDSDDQDTDTDTDNEVDILARPIDYTKAVASTKDTPVRWLKIVRYIKKHQQVHKEKYVKAQTDRLRHYGFDTSSASKGAHTGLKRQTTSSRNNILTFFLKLGLFYEGYLDRYKAALAVAQSNALNIFINTTFFYRANTVVYARALKLI